MCRRVNLKGFHMGIRSHEILIKGIFNKNNMETEFFLIDIDYVYAADGASIRLWGKDEKGRRVVAFDKFRPYFYIVAENSAQLKKALKKEKVEYKEEDKRFMNKKVHVFKVFVKYPKDVPRIREKFKHKHYVKDIFEYDIPFIKRYLIDKKITPMSLIKVSGREENTDFNVDKVIVIDKITSVAKFIDNLKVFGFDIETSSDNLDFSSGSNPIICVSLFGKDYKKVITWKPVKTSNVLVVKNEKELLETFVDIINKEKPDVLCGYNTDLFDFKYIIARANKLEVKLNLGLDGSSVNYGKTGRSNDAQIVGLVHLDLYPFVRNMLSSTLKTSTLDLNSVSKELLGEKKLDMDWERIRKFWKKGGKYLKEIVKYNLQDSYLAFRLAEEFLPILTEISKLAGLRLHDASRATTSMLVEGLFMEEVQKFNELIPSIPHGEKMIRRQRTTFKGGYVHEPKPGLYKHIASLDFRSLYPSIIASHNICPTGSKKGFLPTALERLIKKRLELKKQEKTKAAHAKQYALKLFANAAYGNMGYPRARWYSLECAKKITELARKYIKSVIAKSTKSGFKVLYGDTDGLMVLLQRKKQKDILKFVNKINKSLPGLMELEFEGFYLRGLFVTKRSGSAGAKKRYALVTKDKELIIKGFQYVRRDNSNIAKETQYKVLKSILIDQSVEKALKIVKKAIADLKSHKILIKDVTVSTVLKKAIEAYLQKGPHVRVAMRLKDKGERVGAGTLIQYVVVKGKGSIGDRSRTIDEVEGKKLKYDSDYYIDHQVIPAVEQIFEALKYNKNDLLGKKQEGLGKWMKR